MNEVTEAKMVDITGKPSTYREATATGSIRLRPETIERIRRGEVEKGDVFSIAQTAGIIAAKKTYELIPMCHPIPITQVSIKLWCEGDTVKVEARVRTTASTGVEMEALVAASTALLTVWDMVKKYEKDKQGQYPTTKIFDVRVVSKVKR